MWLCICAFGGKIWLERELISFINMLESLINILKDIPKELLVVIVAALPIAELRLAIPLALSLGMSFNKAFMLSIFGNLIPVLPLLFLLEPVTERLRRFKIWANFFNWFFARTRKKAKIVEKYAALGLMLFVAVPLPMTGAWTGIVASSLFKIRFRYAFFAITFGVIFAGLIVSFLCKLGLMSIKLIK